MKPEPLPPPLFCALGGAFGGLVAGSLCPLTVPAGLQCLMALCAGFLTVGFLWKIIRKMQG